MGGVKDDTRHKKDGFPLAEFRRQLERAISRQEWLQARPELELGRQRLQSGLSLPRL